MSIKNIKKLIKQINFRQPKYILPAILFLPILETFYFAIGILTTDTCEMYDADWDHIYLPVPLNEDDDHESKYERMMKTYNMIKDEIENDNYEHREY